MVSGINSTVLINAAVKSARNLRETPEMIEKEIKKKDAPLVLRQVKLLLPLKIFLPVYIW